MYPNNSFIATILALFVANKREFFFISFYWCVLKYTLLTDSINSTSKKFYSFGEEEKGTC